jgi:hypothetical protein
MRQVCVAVALSRFACIALLQQFTLLGTPTTLPCKLTYTVKKCTPTYYLLVKSRTTHTIVPSQSCERLTSLYRSDIGKLYFGHNDCDLTYYCVHGSAPPAILKNVKNLCHTLERQKHRISPVDPHFLPWRQQYTAASPVDHLNLSYLPPLSIPQQAASPESL